MRDLSWWASLTTLATFLITLLGALIGVCEYARYRCELRKKTKRLEEYLRGEKAKAEDRGQRSILRIIRDVGLTEDEIIKISFRSPKITRRVGKDEMTGLANALLFEYSNSDHNQ